ncbi:hypothetical protein V7038_19930, partial [Bacillus sp. JJ783]
KFKFLKPNLNAAKDSWKTLRADAFTLNEGIKTLKMDPVSSKNRGIRVLLQGHLYSHKMIFYSL